MDKESTSFTWWSINNHSIKPSDDQYDLSKLDVSQITNMKGLFRGSPFNGDISQWDTSNATNIQEAISSLT